MRLLTLSALFVIAACSGGSTDESGITADDATFTTVSDEILFKSCALSTCHLPGESGASESGLTIDPNDPQATYDALVNATGATGKTLVVPNDVAGSYLVDRVQGTQDAAEGDPMPPPFGLSAEQTAQIVAWIEDGAPNN